MRAFIPGKLKAVMLALTFALLLFLDAPEYILCTHVSLDEIYDFPRVCSREKMASACEYFESYNRINKVIQIYTFPERLKRMSYTEIKRQEELLFLRHIDDYIYVGDLKRQNIYWKYNANARHDSQISIHEVTNIETMNQSAVIRFIVQSENTSLSLHNPLDTVLRI